MAVITSGALSPAIPLVYRQAEISRMFGVTRQTISRWRREGNFPKPIHLGANSVAWHAKDIDAWLDSRRTEANQTAGQGVKS